MGLKRAVANALSFAHLSVLGPAAKPTASSDPDDGNDDHKKPGDDPDAARAEGDGNDDPRKKRDDETDDEYAARMKQMDDEASAAATAAAPTAAAARVEDQPGYAAGRLAERDRCAAIFASPTAARNVALAAELAFGSDLAPDRVAAILAKAPAQAAVHPQRAARNPQVGADAPAPVSPQQAAGSRWDQHLQAAKQRGRG